MCSIFGTSIDNIDLLRRLGISGILRGKEATGVTTIHGGLLDVYKEPSDAYRFDWDSIKRSADFYMGHTRKSTGGSPYQNQNNHPFISEDKSISLAHNGVLFNDWDLAVEWNLPDTDIQTDSYVALQMLELVKYMYGEDELNLEIIKETCELLRGLFALTILDDQGQLYLLRHKEPLFYKYDGYNLIYASTKKMLEETLKDVPFEMNALIQQIPENTIYQYDTIHNKFIDSIPFRPLEYKYRRRKKYNNNVIDFNEKKKEKEGKNLPVVVEK